MFLVFEGLDGTGKTSLAKEIVSRLNGRYLKTPPPEYENSRKKIHSTKNPYIRFLFYLSANVFLSESIRKLPKDLILVCDRYFYTSIADFSYTSKMTAKDKDLIFWLKLMNRICIQPDIVFFCHCERDERKKRISNRNVTKVADDLSFQFEKAMLDTYKKILPYETTFFLDTTIKTVNQLSEFIFSISSFRKKLGSFEFHETRSLLTSL